MYYSAATGGFYDEYPPVDAVSITAAAYAKLMEGQSAGQRIVADPQGWPILQDHPTPAPVPMTKEQVERARRAAYRDESDQLKMEADYESQRNGGEPNYTFWLAKVEEIKARFPMPDIQL